jgi:streptogramin lyase
LAAEDSSADGTGSDARFNKPSAAATDSVGNVYVADTGNQTIRKITSAGVVTKVAGSAAEHKAVIGDFRPFIKGGSADGIGSDARFSDPSGVATDTRGNVFVADTGNNTIRKITPAGVVTTLAGSEGERGSGADGTGSAARFYGPAGVSTDSAGNVYVADTGNHTIRRITPAGVVTTVAGSPGLIGSADGAGSAARFNRPRGVAIDSGGNVYVADTGNNTIRIGRPTLADAATIDSSTGAAGAKRQLDTTPQTATSWHWRIVRQPSGSAAKLSSTSIRNPLFIPDVADLYTFQLTASNGGNTSITTVSLTATASLR